MLCFCGQHLVLADKLQTKREADNCQLFVPGKSTSTSIAMLVLPSAWLGLPSCWFVSIFAVDVFFLTIEGGCRTEQENSQICVT